MILIFFSLLKHISVYIYIYIFFMLHYWSIYQFTYFLPKYYGKHVFSSLYSASIQYIFKITLPISWSRLFIYFSALMGIYISASFQHFLAVNSDIYTHMLICIYLFYYIFTWLVFFFFLFFYLCWTFSFLNIFTKEYITDSVLM